MPDHRIPLDASGSWTRLESANGAHLYRRDMTQPDGQPVSIFYAGSEHSPEVISSDDEARVRLAYGQMQR